MTPPCSQHRVLGYAYIWLPLEKRSVLICRGCGEPDTAHETLRETIERTSRDLYGDDWTPPMTGHVTAVALADDHGYPYSAACSCGWMSWGYLTEWAAASMADDHINTVTMKED